MPKKRGKNEKNRYDDTGDGFYYFQFISTTIDNADNCNTISNELPFMFLFFFLLVNNNKYFKPIIVLKQTFYAYPVLLIYA